MRSTVITYLILFAVVDLLIPLPLLAFVLLWVAVKRPAWFTDLVKDVYADSP